jgi:actin-related protein
MRLFLAQSYAEVTQLAQEEPLFLKVCEVLEMVSKNSKMQDRARMIWEGEFAVRNEKYLLEKERLEEKMRYEKERLEEKMRYEKERLEEKMRIEKEAEQKVAAAQHEAALRVAEAQREADQKVFEAQQALSKAVRTLSATGQTPDAIATLLNLSPERVIEILNTP